MSTFADTLKALRKQAGWSQAQLAAALSGPDKSSRCSVRTVQAWEAGRQSPPEWWQYQIAGIIMRQSLK